MQLLLETRHHQNRKATALDINGEHFIKWQSMPGNYCSMKIRHLHHNSRWWCCNTFL